MASTNNTNGASSGTSNILMDLLAMQMNVIKTAADAAGNALPADVSSVISSAAETLTNTVMNTANAASGATSDTNAGDVASGIAASVSSTLGSAGKAVRDAVNNTMNSTMNTAQNGTSTSMPFGLPNFGLPNFGFASGITELQSLYETWNNLYTSWMGSMGKLPAVVSDIVTSGSVVSNAMNNVSSMAQTYFKLSELWTPAMKLMQENNLTMETLQKYLSIENYNAILGSTFNLASQETVQKFMEQISSVATRFGDAGEFAAGTASEIAEQASKAASTFAAGDIDGAAKIYIQMIDGIQKPVSPITNMVFLGRDRAIMDRSQEMLRAYILFAAHYAKLQQMVFSAGRAALTELTTRIMDNSRDGKAPQTFDEFFTLWIRANESAFDALFHTDEYSKMQADLSTSSARVKEHTDKFFEMMISDFPIATRSEMDEAYHSIHTLKSQMRKLERKLAEQDEVIELLKNGSKTPSSNNGTTNVAPKSAQKAAVKTTVRIATANAKSSSAAKPKTAPAKAPAKKAAPAAKATRS
jgi:polyhydroxyalkanoate synthase subunit PhaE